MVILTRRKSLNLKTSEQYHNTLLNFSSYDLPKRYFCSFRSYCYQFDELKRKLDNIIDNSDKKWKHGCPIDNHNHISFSY